MSGQVSFSLLWEQHQEHRLFIPKLILAVLASHTHWNSTFERMLNFGLACCTLLVGLRQLHKTPQGLRGEGNGWITLATVLFIFSLQQAETGFGEWQVQIHLNVLCVVTGLFILSSDKLSNIKFTLNMLLGVAATFCFANGLFFWLLGWIILLVRIMIHKKSEKKSSLILWSCVGLGVFILYFHGLHLPASRFSGHSGFSLVGYLQYVLNWIGSTFDHGRFIGYTRVDVGPFQGVAPFFGMIGLILLFGGSWHLLKTGQANIMNLLPWWSISGYALASAVVTGAGRLHLGIGQSLNSRYVTISSLIWISVLVLLWMNINASNGRRHAGASRRFASGYQGPIVFLILMMLQVWSSWGARELFSYNFFKLKQEQCAVLFLNKPDVLSRISTNTEILLKRIEILRVRKLSVFRESAENPEVYRDEISVWHDVVRRYPRHYRAHLNLGRALTEHNKAAEAIPVLLKANFLNPRSGTVYYNLGEAWLKQKEFGKGIEALLQALGVDPIIRLQTLGWLK